MSTRLFGWMAAGLLACGSLSGCGSSTQDSPTSPTEADAKNAATPVESTSSNGRSNSSSSGAAHSAQSDPPDDSRFDQQVTAVQTAIDSGNLDSAHEKLAELRVSLGESPGEEQLGKIRLVEKLLSERRNAMRHEERTKLLAAAKTAFDTGEWDESLKQIDAVAALAPGEAERETLNALRSSIDQAMKAQLRLGTWIKMLGSGNSGEVKTAQTQLLEEPEAALPLVRLAIRGDDPVTTKNAMEFLRKLRKPEVALPMMVSILEDPTQQASWEIASREIVRQEHPGAGAQLLQLVLTSSVPEQRTAATTALANIVDPPEATAGKGERRQDAPGTEP